MRRPIPWLLAALIALAGYGCSADPAAPVDGTAVPRLSRPSGGAVMALDKLDVDIGTVARDQQAIETFIIGSIGDRDLRVRVVDYKILEGCDAIDVTTEAAVVPARDVLQLPVATGPHRDLGPHRYSLTLESNDPSRSSRTLSIRFNVAEPAVRQAAGPNLRVDKSVIDTGDMPYDWPMYERFTLRNAGDMPLVIESSPVVRVEAGC